MKLTHELAHGDWRHEMTAAALGTSWRTIMWAFRVEWSCGPKPRRDVEGLSAAVLERGTRDVVLWLSQHFAVNFSRGPWQGQKLTPSLHAGGAGGQATGLVVCVQPSCLPRSSSSTGLFLAAARLLLSATSLPPPRPRSVDLWGGLTQESKRFRGPGARLGKLPRSHSLPLAARSLPKQSECDSAAVEKASKLAPVRIEPDVPKPEHSRQADLLKGCEGKVVQGGTRFSDGPWAARWQTRSRVSPAAICLSWLWLQPWLTSLSSRT